jgi:hypothetical protein
LADFAGDHVHADAATGEAADGLGGREAGLQDQHVEVGITQHRIRLDQAAFDRARANRGTIDAAAVVADLQHHFRTFAPDRDADAAFLALAGLAAYVRRLQAMRHGIA